MVLLVARIRIRCSVVYKDILSVSSRIENSLENTASYNTHPIVFLSSAYRYSVH